MNLIDKLKNKIIKKTVGISSAEALELFIKASNHPWTTVGCRFRNSGTLQAQRNHPLRHYQCQIERVP